MYGRFGKPNFKIIKEINDDTDNDEGILAPNTGVFTNEDGGSKMINDMTIAVIVGIIVLMSFLIRKEKQVIRD